MPRLRRVGVPEEQRVKIEERHAAELAALAEHAAAASRLAAAEGRVAEARDERLAAAATLAGLIGAERAAELTGLAVTELRRRMRETVEA